MRFLIDLPWFVGVAGLGNLRPWAMIKKNAERLISMSCEKKFTSCQTQDTGPSLLFIC